jgi:hypothetical protein
VLHDFCRRLIAPAAAASIAVAGLLLTPPLASAQNHESKSAALATELTGLLEQMKLDSVAAQYADQFVGALYIPGTQLLVVSAKGPPTHFGTLLKNKSYRDAYIDLNGMADASKLFFSDLGANGLRFKRENNQPYDTVDSAGKTYAFDGDWGKAKISEQDYAKTYDSYDTKYSEMLQALIAALKKPS